MGVTVYQGAAMKRNRPAVKVAPLVQKSLLLICLLLQGQEKAKPELIAAVLTGVNTAPGAAAGAQQLLEVLPACWEVCVQHRVPFP